MQTVLVSFRCTILCCFFAVLCVITDSKGAETRLFAFKSVKITGNSRISSQQLYKTLGITIPTEGELRQNMDFQGVLTPSLFSYYFPYATVGKRNIFLDSIILTNKLENVLNLYQRKGYFNSDIKLTIDIDTSDYGDITINCNEGLQYHISDLLISDSLIAQSIPWQRLHNSFIQSSSRLYDEDSLQAFISRSLHTLHEEGYASLEYTIENVFIDTTEKQVVSLIKLNNTERFKVQAINFEHSIDTTLSVKNDVLARFIPIKPDQWLSPNAVNRSKSMLIGLSFFDEVNARHIPTITPTDTLSTINFRLKYKKPQEVVFSIFLNRTTNDNFLNMGAEASYSDLMTSRTGMSFLVFSRLLAQDISRTLFSNQRSIEFEYSIGTTINQPFAFFINEQRIPLTYSAQISLRNLPSNLKLLVPLIRISNFNTFPEWTLFSNLNFDITFDFSRLINFTTISRDSSDDYLRLIAPYISLSDYYKNNPFKPASFTLGMTLTGDRRNSVIAPTSGYFLTLPQVEYAPNIGYSNFLRFLTQFNTFTSLDKNIVLATKLKAGYIFNFGFSSSDQSTPPFEKHFFAGGANSVRAWPSRGLLDAQSSISDSLENLVDELSYIIGSAGLIEGSIELRITLAKPTSIGEFWADKIARSGFVLFADWGNSFNRLTPGTYQKADISRILSPSHWGLGYGLGFRFETPAGPFRLDIAFPLYDPNSAAFSQPNFAKAQYHIGLGHAF